MQLADLPELKAEHDSKCPFCHVKGERGLPQPCPVADLIGLVESLTVGSSAEVAVLRAPLKIVLEALEPHVADDPMSSDVGGASLYLMSCLVDEEPEPEPEPARARRPCLRRGCGRTLVDGRCPKHGDPAPRASDYQ